MESILNIIVNAENGRMLILMAFAYVGYTKLNGRIDGLKYDVNKRIDGVEASIKDESTAMNRRIDSVEASIKELKYNDLAAIHGRIDELSATMDMRIDDLKNNDLAAINRRIDDLKNNDLAAINRRIDDLKNNDFAHLNGTIEALTYALEKNGSIKHEDKEYVDSRLAH